MTTKVMNIHYKNLNNIEILKKIKCFMTLSSREANIVN